MYQIFARWLVRKLKASAELEMPWMKTNEITV